MKTDVCIIGAGPSGLMSAIFAADSGAETIVVESNSSPGRKLLLTGGRRCNITHRAEPDELVRLLENQGRFLSFCLHEYSPGYVLDFFAGIGIQTKIEDDGCIFPVSYKAQEVRDALLKKAESLNIKFLCNKPVIDIEKGPGGFLIKTKSLEILAEKLIIATGGISYPRTGSTGDGYHFAKKLGHTIVPPRASLVPLVVKENWPARIAGTALEKVMISANLNSKKYFSQGAIVFTNNGIGGPAAQDMSRYLTDFLPAKQPVKIELDLFGDLNPEQLETQIIKNINENSKKNISNLLSDYLPKRIASLICELTGCDGDLQAGQLKKQNRQKIIRQIKALPLSVLRTRSIEEATVTRGGVSIKEINPKTMESKICPGLFFAGEVMDVDGPCGGYNLQICWSTGALAGACAAKK